MDSTTVAVFDLLLLIRADEDDRLMDVPLLGLLLVVSNKFFI
jgi:hypothetical protein